MNGSTQNTSGHPSSIIMPPWSQHFSQALLVYEHSIHPSPSNGEINNEGKWLSWFHCTLAFEWALMNLEVPEGAWLT